jgi:hypothetical protein
MQKWRNVAALAVLVLLPTLPAVASTFVAMTPGELIAHSDAVVVGDVIHVESFRDPSGRAIVTQAMIRVEETLTGSSPTVVVVQTFGGTVDSYTVVAHGFLLVFLEEHADGIAEVVGYRLGQYRVITNRFGEEIAVPTLEKNVSLLRPEGGEAVRPQAMPLSTLKTLVRREAQRLHRSF